jgi:uncharacterized spore protein YtfJ
LLSAAAGDERCKEGERASVIGDGGGGGCGHRKLEPLIFICNREGGKRFLRVNGGWYKERAKRGLDMEG